MTTQNTQNNTQITLTQEMLQSLISNAVVQAINATKKPSARKANTRATVKLGADGLLAELAKLGIEPKTDVWLYTAKSGRTTLFCQFSKTESAELDFMGSIGFESWANKDSKRDMWQGGRIVRLYADVPEGAEGNYEAFRR